MKTTMVQKFASFTSHTGLVIGTGVAVIVGQIAPALAATTGQFGADNTKLNVNTENLPQQINNIVNTVFLLLGFIAVLLIIYAGVKLIVSRGNEAAMKEATKLLTYTVIGFLLILLSYGIVRFIVTLAVGANSNAAPAVGANPYT